MKVLGPSGGYIGPGPSVLWRHERPFGTGMNPLMPKESFCGIIILLTVLE